MLPAIHLYDSASATACRTTRSTPSSGRGRSAGSRRTNAHGRVNLAPYSFFNAFNYTPPIVGFYAHRHEVGRLTATDVARLTLKAVRQERFYVFTHPRAIGGVEQRLRDIVQGHVPANPMGSAP